MIEKNIFWKKVYHEWNLFRAPTWRHTDCRRSVCQRNFANVHWIFCCPLTRRLYWSTAGSFCCCFLEDKAISSGKERRIMPVSVVWSESSVDMGIRIPPCSRSVENKEGILIPYSWPTYEDLRSVENKGNSYSRGTAVQAANIRISLNIDSRPRDLQSKFCHFSGQAARPCWHRRAWPSPQAKWTRWRGGVAGLDPC